MKNIVCHFFLYVTWSDKTNLIAVKYTYSFYGTYNLFWWCYSNSVSFIEFLRVFCIYDKLCVKILFSEKILLSFKSLKLAQNLHGNKTGFVRPGHIYSCSNLSQIWTSDIFQALHSVYCTIHSLVSEPLRLPFILLIMSDHFWHVPVIFSPYITI